jgi:non-ribosomal peptide synthase protein (TIGR01720 family)
VDVSRTVGWFTSLYPVWLEAVDGTVKERLAGTRERLREVPGRGMGYGMLRYLSGPAEEERATRLRSCPEPEVVFNYLGQFDQALQEGGPWRLAPESSGPAQSPRQKRPYPLEINAVVHGGSLRLQWSYSRNLHHPDTLQRVARHFRDILRALAQHASLEHRPPAGRDLAALDVSEQELEDAMREFGATQGGRR